MEFLYPEMGILDNWRPTFPTLEIRALPMHLVRSFVARNTQLTVSVSIMHASLVRA